MELVRANLPEGGAAVPVSARVEWDLLQLRQVPFKNPSTETSGADEFGSVLVFLVPVGISAVFDDFDPDRAKVGDFLSGELFSYRVGRGGENEFFWQAGVVAYEDGSSQVSNSDEDVNKHKLLFGVVT